ncbi:pyridoxamine 5'-phosphate oxidase family protein [Ideonella azotifigens]|uniref:Pyridoxamine 5'-phosphate oxidase family protein n=1 Tax=Ideonella azotifigens TaxID=513160 RepID=A0ABP3UXF5_9BURK|nr:pyridoxamine 5'-phosphate oxidase family protein [Ideonella azotifigens]MCD2340144.1 pyridoxamine 5'-phosphate oxidase family protein [Ideonella azotifigens]
MSPPSARTRVKRLAELARYDAATLHAIVDASYLCHIAFHDGSSSHCIPTACWRDGERLYVHGSNGGRLVKLLGSGRQVSVAITLMDGLVLAKSAFNHSMNYRSAVIYGSFEAVAGEAEKRRLMDVFMHKIAPGREHDARPGNDKEFAATTLLALPLNEAAAKVRTGGPQDDAEDLDLPVWAGVLPLLLQPQAPVAAPHSTVPAPAYVTGWHGRSPLPR